MVSRAAGGHNAKKPANLVDDDTTQRLRARAQSEVKYKTGRSSYSLEYEYGSPVDLVLLGSEILPGSLISLDLSRSVVHKSQVSADPKRAKRGIMV